MSRPVLLDLFCGLGGAGMGYHRAGFEVIGVDIEPQPDYPFEFIQDDALELLRSGDVVPAIAVHASPPCQASSNATKGNRKRAGWMDEHIDLIPDTRRLLDAPAGARLAEARLARARASPAPWAEASSRAR